jgi:hypothetical protein
MYTHVNINILFRTSVPIPSSVCTVSIERLNKQACDLIHIYIFVYMYLHVYIYIYTYIYI